MSNVYVVGLGPGNIDNLTIGADRVLRSCDIIIGYSVYVDLVRDRYPEAEFQTTGMRQEVKRCEMALEQAAEGKNVAMVCSGDSGIYGMAALLFELRGEAECPSIEVIPGITAACSGGAVLGAPLTHDFAVISLSDRLTDWEKIEKRLELAAEADLAIALYNPASHGRPNHLRRACEILLRHLPDTRPCGVVRNIGREGQEQTILTLGKLMNYPADMFCTVFIGNADTQVIGDRLVTPRGYRHE